jgi:Cu-Zn family superoxide dismutase
MRNLSNRFALVATLALAAPFAFAQQDHGHSHAPAAASVERAIVVLQPTEGSKASGTVEFKKVADGVEITARVEGLDANGKHGFHIHEFGDATSPDGTAMGGHFNPTGAPHAGPDADQRHVGDFGNLEADDNGVATYSRVDKHITFEGATSILGRGMIVHAGTDDLESQPTGDAGARIAQGIIAVDGPDEEKK